MDFLLTNKKTFHVAYHITKFDKWHWHENCSSWEAWFLCKTCLELGREVRLQNCSCKTVNKFPAGSIELLNLFFKRITDRTMVKSTVEIVR